MHIVFFVNSFWPRLGGVESHVAALASHLTQLGHRVDVFTLSEGSVSCEVATGAAAAREVRDGVTIHRWPMRIQVGGVFSLPKPGFKKWVLRELHGQLPDVISVHTRFFPLTWFGAKLGKKLGVPVIHTEHGSGFVVSPSPLISAASKMVDLTLGRRAMRRAQKIVGVSENAAAFATRLSGVPTEVFYNAIELPEPDFAQKQADENSASDVAGPDARGCRNIVFVGRIVAGKGWDATLEVARRLDKKQPLAAAVHILGQGLQFEQLRARVTELSLDDAVVLHGHVTPAEVSELLRGNVLINPTVLAEGFQTTLLEAIAVAAEVVTYPVPGAELLREQGFPVSIVPRGDIGGLVAATLTAIMQPPVTPQPELLVQWSWTQRARDYEKLCRAVVGE